jgi:hypothetical protein
MYENKLVLFLMDRDEEITEFLLDCDYSELTDQFGSPAIDFEGHPFVQTQPTSKNHTNAFLDAFLLKPSPGVSFEWLESENVDVYKSNLEGFKEAILLLTGKLVVGIYKYEKRN